VADEPDPLRVQLPPLLKLPFVLGLTEKVTEPVGVMVGAVSVSVTVAVQVVPVLASTVDGEQLTLVLVDRAVIVNALLVAELREPLVAFSV
jgi:GMP synthase PP-ATPase subunit